MELRRYLYAQVNGMPRYSPLISPQWQNIICGYGISSFEVGVIIRIYDINNQKLTVVYFIEYFRYNLIIVFLIRKSQTPTHVTYITE